MKKKKTKAKNLLLKAQQRKLQSNALLNQTETKELVEGSNIFLEKSIRSAAVQMVKEGMTRRDIAKHLKVNEQTIGRYIEGYVETARAIHLIENDYGQEVDLRTMSNAILSLVSRSVVTLHEKAAAGKQLSGNEIKTLLDINTELDRMDRLDKGGPTEIIESRVLTVNEIRKKLEEVDPFTVEVSKEPMKFNEIEDKEDS